MFIGVYRCRLGVFRCLHVLTGAYRCLQVFVAVLIGVTGVCRCLRVLIGAYRCLYGV